MKIEKLNYRLTSHGTIILNEPIVQYHWKILNHKMFSLNDIYFAAHNKKLKKSDENWIIQEYELAKNYKWPKIDGIEPKQSGHYGIYKTKGQTIRIIKINQEFIGQINIRGMFSKNLGTITSRNKNLTTNNIKDFMDELYTLKLKIL